MRKQELKRLKEKLSQAEYQALQGTMWLFRKNAANLRPALEPLLNDSTRRRGMSAAARALAKPDAAEKVVALVV